MIKAMFTTAQLDWGRQGGSTSVSQCPGLGRHVKGHRDRHRGRVRVIPLSPALPFWGLVVLVPWANVGTGLVTRWQGGRYGSGGAKIAVVCPAVRPWKQFFANILQIFWSFKGVHWWKWRSRRCAFDGYNFIQQFFKICLLDVKTDRTLVMTISTAGHCTSSDFDVHIHIQMDIRGTHRFWWDFAQL